MGFLISDLDKTFTEASDECYTVLETLDTTGFSPGWTESSPTLNPQTLEIEKFLLPKIQIHLC